MTKASYLNQLLFLVSVATVLMLANPAKARAQVAYIDHLTVEDSQPISAKVILEMGTGSVQILEAQVTELPNTSRSLISAQTSSKGSSRAPSGGVAFVTSPLRESPEIEFWNPELILFNQISENSLQRDTLDLDQSIQKIRIKSVELQDLISAQETELIRKLEIPALRDVMEEQRELRRSIDEQQREIARLETVIEDGRNLPTPENINSMRIELSEHLREAAKVTSVADRLTRRKLEAARLRLKEKLNMIEELKKQDPAALAREILKLRKERRELENRLGITSKDSAQDQF